MSSSNASQRYAEAMTRLEVLDPDAYRAVKARVESYKTMNIKLRQTERNLTASVVQLENDYDQIEGELKAVVLSAKAVRPKRQAKVVIL